MPPLLRKHPTSLLFFGARRLRVVLVPRRHPVVQEASKQTPCLARTLSSRHRTSNNPQLLTLPNSSSRSSNPPHNPLVL
jgi:hypothetical protein